MPSRVQSILVVPSLESYQVEPRQVGSSRVNTIVILKQISLLKKYVIDRMKIADCRNHRLAVLSTETNARVLSSREFLTISATLGFQNSLIDTD